MIDEILAKTRQRRSIGILNGFLGTATQSPLSRHPVWKVHRYSGIHLRPVHPDELHYHDDSEITEYDEHESRVSEDEEAPSLIEIPETHAKNYPNDEIHLEHNYEESHKATETQKVLEMIGLARSDQKAEDKIGKVAHFIKKAPLKKKKKKIIKLVALAKLLKKIKEGKIAVAKGKIALAKGEIALEDLVGGLINKVTLPEPVYPIKSAVYRKIPVIYPKGPSILSKLPIIGSRFAPFGSPIIVPEPILPEIPALSLVPEAPKLPHLYVSGPYKVPYSTGSYVSIKVPKPHQVHDSYGPPSIDTPPSTSYGVPFEKPIKVYGSQPQPRDPVYTQYAAPVQQYQPSTQLFNPSAPEYQPAQQYGTPAPEYQSAPPQNSPPAQYSQLSTDYQSSQQYTPSAQDYQQQYSPPVQQYGPPSPEYQQAAPQYSAPVLEQIQSPQYNSVSYQQTQYAYPAAAQKKSFKENESEISSSSWQAKKESILDSSENDEVKET